MARNRRKRRQNAAYKKRLVRGQIATTHGVLVALRVHLRKAGFEDDSIEQIMLFNACFDLEMLINPGALYE